MYCIENRLDYRKVQCLELNDFLSFDQWLFTPEEYTLPDRERWLKFIFHTNMGRSELDACAVIFEDPKTVVEAQINHYVMWNCIAHYYVHSKPPLFFDYRTGRCYWPDDFMENSCWACQWALKYKNQRFFTNNTCVACPIWDVEREEADCPCEADGTSNETYVNWTNTFSPKWAEELAIAPWVDRIKILQCSRYLLITVDSDRKINTEEFRNFREARKARLIDASKILEQHPNGTFSGSGMEIHFTDDVFHIDWKILKVTIMNEEEK